MGSGFIWFIVIGVVVGWLAGPLMLGGGFGRVGNLIVGVLGASLGGFLFQQSGAFARYVFIGSLIVAAARPNFVIWGISHQEGVAGHVINRSALTFEATSDRLRTELQAAGGNEFRI